MIIGTTEITKVFGHNGELYYISYRDLEDPPYEYREYSCGTRVWYRDGECHKEDGPALERSDGAKFWYEKGKLLRWRDLPK